jgi:hypothetical protein
MSGAIRLRSNWREHRSELISDWAILNDTKSSQLRRILATVHSCTDIEIEQACHLLESYHAVYRHNLMRLRAQGCRGKCPLPTTAQLQQIAQHLQTKTYQSYSPQQLMHELQALAQKLRQRREVAQERLHRGLVEATDVVRVAPSVFSLDYSDRIIQKPD